MKGNNIFNFEKFKRFLIWTESGKFGHLAILPAQLEFPKNPIVSCTPLRNYRLIYLMKNYTV